MLRFLHRYKYKTNNSTTKLSPFESKNYFYLETTFVYNEDLQP